MKLTEYIKKLIRDYFIIFAIIVIGTTILCQIFVPNKYLEVKDIFIYMICALAGDLPGLIFYSPKEIPENEMRLRILVHFVVLEAVLLILANVMGWVSGMLNTAIVAVQIALIYIVVRFLSWLNDRNSAHSINEKLNEIKNQTANESELE